MKEGFGGVAEKCTQRRRRVRWRRRRWRKSWIELLTNLITLL